MFPITRYFWLLATVVSSCAFGAVCTHGNTWAAIFSAIVIMFTTTNCMESE